LVNSGAKSNAWLESVYRLRRTTSQESSRIEILHEN
jgi:hypothetical protein